MAINLNQSLQNNQVGTQPLAGTGAAYQDPTPYFGSSFDGTRFNDPSFQFQYSQSGVPANPLNPATLPALRSAGGGTSSVDPTFLPYLQLGLRGAEQLFLNQAPSLYPGQMYVDPSRQTLAALQGMEQTAYAAQPILGAGVQAFLSGAGKGAERISVPSGPVSGQSVLEGLASGTGIAGEKLQQLYGAAGQPIAGQDLYRQAIGGGLQNLAMPGFQQVAGGSFLQGSPYRDALIQAATRPLAQQFSEQVIPGISSQFSAAGRYGSGAMQRAQSGATEAFGRALGDVTANITAADYARERGFQESARQQLAGLSQQDIANRFAGAGALGAAQQAQIAQQLGIARELGSSQLSAAQALGQIGISQQSAQTQAAIANANAAEAAARRQLEAAQLAGNIYQQQFAPSQMLGQVGSAYEQIAAQPLQEDIMRYQYQQQLPYQQLAGYTSSIYGAPFSSAVQQSQSNPFLGALGGAAIGGQLFGPIGAIGGGLLGAFGS